jgi:hypothetical protein
MKNLTDYYDKHIKQYDNQLYEIVCNKALDTAERLIKNATGRVRPHDDDFEYSELVNSISEALLRRLKKSL